MTSVALEPTYSPCSPWVDASDVANCCSVDLDDEGPPLLTQVAEMASDALFNISGRLFTGECTRTVRPCAEACGCFGQPSSLGLGPWYWTNAWYAGGYGWRWRNECGDTCGCDPLSRVKLAGYPVTSITDVKVDGVSVDPAGYRLDGWRWLVRLDDPGPPVVKRYWPSCQNLALADTEPGTFSVTYKHGMAPPLLGAQAACQLACQFYLACNGQPCQLPAGVTEVVRQGVKIERGLLANFLDPKKPTGLVLVDAFLRAHWCPSAKRRPAVWSPDVQPFARRVGV